jgi:hypothetical protein
MVEALGITIMIDRRPKGRPRKMESKTVEKIECTTILIKHYSLRTEESYIKYMDLLNYLTNTCIIYKG